MDKSEKGLIIFKGIREFIDKFGLWSSIKYIITDTRSVNTSRKGAVVRLLQHNMKSLLLSYPQFFGCQHYIPDLILWHFMDDILNKTTSLKIKYYNERISCYKQRNTRVYMKSKMARRHAIAVWPCICLRYYVKHKEFPYIKFRMISPNSNARSNLLYIYNHSSNA